MMVGGLRQIAIPQGNGAKIPPQEMAPRLLSKWASPIRKPTSRNGTNPRWKWFQTKLDKAVECLLVKWEERSSARPGRPTVDGRRRSLHAFLRSQHRCKLPGELEQVSPLLPLS